MSNGSGSTNATLILVLGILSIVCLPILGPVAWIMGNNALKELDQGFGDPQRAWTGGRRTHSGHYRYGTAGAELRVCGVDVHFLRRDDGDAGQSVVHAGAGSGVSTISVTGPSFCKRTCISAP